MQRAGRGRLTASGKESRIPIIPCLMSYQTQSLEAAVSDGIRHDIPPAAATGQSNLPGPAAMTSPKTPADTATHTRHVPWLMAPSDQHSCKPIARYGVLG